MAQIATGNGTVVSGNATRLTASCTLLLADGTRVVNGNALVPWSKEIVINAGSNAGNISFCAASSAATAANAPFGLGLAGISGSAFVISPAMLADCQGANTTLYVNDVYVASSANTTFTIMVH